MDVDRDFLIAIVVSVAGLGIGIWFLISRLRAKLSEVEARQKRKAEID